jgi:hypothetical protein
MPTEPPPTALSRKAIEKEIDRTVSMRQASAQPLN